MPGMEGTREIETQTQSPPSLHFLLVPVISQAQQEVGRQRSSADALQRSQPPGVQSRWKLDCLLLNYSIYQLFYIYLILHIKVSFGMLSNADFHL